MYSSTSAKAVHFSLLAALDPSIAQVFRHFVLHEFTDAISYNYRTGAALL
jgi:hypothetical protein